MPLFQTSEWMAHLAHDPADGPCLTYSGLASRPVVDAYRIVYQNQWIRHFVMGKSIEFQDIIAN